LIGPIIANDVEKAIESYNDSRLSAIVGDAGDELLVLKFVGTRRESHYATPRPLKISVTPALTWGTASYVTPLALSLSSLLYGRMGLVGAFDPHAWRIFDATEPSAKRAYVSMAYWAGNRCWRVSRRSALAGSDVLNSDEASVTAYQAHGCLATAWHEVVDTRYRRHYMQRNRDSSQRVISAGSLVALDPLSSRAVRCCGAPTTKTGST
jgi:hypothetical protein